MESTFLRSPLHLASLFPFPSSSSRPHPRHRHRHRFFATSSPSPPNLNLSSRPSPLAPTPLNLPKLTATVLFSLAVALSPLPSPKFHAIAAPAAAAATQTKSTTKKRSTSAADDHEFSDYTRRLLSVIAVLLQRIEEVKSGKGDISSVRAALQQVKSTRKAIQGEVLRKLNAELRELRMEKADLIRRLGEVLDSALEARKESDWLAKEEDKNVGVKEKMEMLESRIGDAEVEYNGLWEKVGEIEERMMRRETLTYSVAIREISFIQRESELLVDRFELQLKRGGLARYQFHTLCSLSV